MVEYIPKFKDFKQFHSYLNNKIVGYHAKYVSNKFNIPKNLQLNIEHYGEFIDTFEKLVHSKLYIWVNKGYNQSKMFYNYILPTAVFLHYMHVNIDNLTQINIYIVNHKIYDRYRLNVGGEYTTGFNKTHNITTHLILIKDYSDLFETNSELKDTSLISLFHELTHLVDNIDFFNDPSPYVIEYQLRCHEIKGKIFSQFFWVFYRGLNETMSLKCRMGIIGAWINDLRDKLMGLIKSINTVLFFNNEVIKIENTIPLRNNLKIMDTSKENIQYYTSLLEISKLNKFFNEFIEVSQK